jgi:two-component system NarL family response regulator
MIPMTTGPVSVLCVDDNPEIGGAIRLKLRSAGGFEWKGQLFSADSLEDQVAQLGPDVVLLDIDMPGADPFAAIAHLTKSHPQVRVVVLSGHVRRELIDQAFAAGAWGYLSKNESADTIIDGVRRVAGGEFVMSSEVETLLDS